MDNLNVFAVEAVARSDAVVAGLLASFAAGPA
jgi:hypothetical protein